MSRKGLFLLVLLLLFALSRVCDGADPTPEKNEGPPELSQRELALLAAFFRTMSANPASTPISVQTINLGGVHQIHNGHGNNVNERPEPHQPHASAQAQPNQVAAASDALPTPSRETESALGASGNQQEPIPRIEEQETTTLAEDAQDEVRLQSAGSAVGTHDTKDIATSSHSQDNTATLVSANMSGAIAEAGASETTSTSAGPMNSIPIGRDSSLRTVRSDDRSTRLEAGSTCTEGHSGNTPIMGEVTPPRNRCPQREQGVARSSQMSGSANAELAQSTGSSNMTQACTAQDMTVILQRGPRDNDFCDAEPTSRNTTEVASRHETIGSAVSESIEPSSFALEATQVVNTTETPHSRPVGSQASPSGSQHSETSRPHGSDDIALNSFDAQNVVVHGRSETARHVSSEDDYGLPNAQSTLLDHTRPLAIFGMGSIGQQDLTFVLPPYSVFFGSSNDARERAGVSSTGGSHGVPSTEGAESAHEITTSFNVFDGLLQHAPDRPTWQEFREEYFRQQEAQAIGTASTETSAATGETQSAPICPSAGSHIDHERNNVGVILAGAGGGREDQSVAVASTSDRTRSAIPRPVLADLNRLLPGARSRGTNFASPLPILAYPPDSTASDLIRLEGFESPDFQHYTYILGRSPAERVGQFIEFDLLIYNGHTSRVRASIEVQNSNRPLYVVQTLRSVAANSFGRVRFRYTRQSRRGPDTRQIVRFAAVDDDDSAADLDPRDYRRDNCQRVTLLLALTRFADLL